MFIELMMRVTPPQVTSSTLQHFSGFFPILEWLKANRILEEKTTENTGGPNKT